MTTKLNFKQSITAGIYAAITSVVINAFLFFVFQGMGVITNNIMVMPNQPLTIVPVIITTILPLIIGSIIFFVIERYTNNGYKIFAILAILFAIFSMLGPFKNIPEVTTSYALVLCTMHIVAVVFILYFIYRQKKKVNDKIN